MIDGKTAAAILIIATFVGFIVWAKTRAGRAALKIAFGEPYPTRAKSGTPRRTKGAAPATARKRPSAPSSGGRASGSSGTPTKRKPTKPSGP
jgi:hypothetical protein